MPKKSRNMHLWDGLAKSRGSYAKLIAEALRREHDDTHRTVKTIMRWTDASERSVKNWLSGESGPSGYFLMRLFVKSAAVRALVMTLLIEAEMPVPSNCRFENDLAAMIPARSKIMEQLAQLGHINGINGDTNGDSIGAMHGTNSPLLNERQEWLLARVARGERCKYADIVMHWQVSSRTAKRDIARLKDNGLIRYFGRHRHGFYVINGHD